MKILYILERYPQLSETYIKSEIDAVKDDFEIKIISIAKTNLHDTEYLEYQLVEDKNELIKLVQEYKPDVIHSHYLHMAELISDICKKLEIPFTIRAHSYDALINGQNNSISGNIYELHKHINHELCKGLLIMPFSLDLVLKYGKVEITKLIPVPCVVNTHKFYNKEPNGNGIMNVGVVQPKKGMVNFVKLSTLLPEKSFNLYGVGYNIDKLKDFNANVGGKVNFNNAIPYSKMPIEYKKNNWLVYTANMEIKTVGWPIAVMEAMASGTMVCMQNIRPDIKDYIGEAGYLFNDVEELVELIRQPVNKEKREFAFEYSKKFDISRSIVKLKTLWANSK